MEEERRYVVGGGAAAEATAAVLDAEISASVRERFGLDLPTDLRRLFLTDALRYQGFREAAAWRATGAHLTLAADPQIGAYADVEWFFPEDFAKAESAGEHGGMPLVPFAQNGAGDPYVLVPGAAVSGAVPIAIVPQDEDVATFLAPDVAGFLVWAAIPHRLLGVPRRGLGADGVGP